MISTSLLDQVGVSFQSILLEMYMQSLEDMKHMLTDIRNYVNHHFYGQGERGISYFCWFLYENIQLMLN